MIKISLTIHTIINLSSWKCYQSSIHQTYEFRIWFAFHHICIFLTILIWTEDGQNFLPATDIFMYMQAWDFSRFNLNSVFLPFVRTIFCLFLFFQKIWFSCYFFSGQSHDCVYSLRKHFLKIFKKFWSKCFRMSRRTVTGTVYWIMIMISFWRVLIYIFFVGKPSRAFRCPGRAGENTGSIQCGRQRTS